MQRLLLKLALSACRPAPLLLQAGPRRAPAPSSRSHSPALSAPASSGGRGGNDVMLFLCQVSFQLQLSPPSSGSGRRVRQRLAPGGARRGVEGPSALSARRLGGNTPPPRALPVPGLRSPGGRKAAAWGPSGIRNPELAAPAPTSAPATAAGRGRGTSFQRGTSGG